MILKNLLITTFSVLIVTSAFSKENKRPPHNPEKEKFRFLINADPQMGAENTNHYVIEILNSLLSDFVQEVNNENKKSEIDFVIYNGDLVFDAFQKAFDNFTRIVSNQQVPTVLVHGNHDGKFPDEKFYNAQQKLSGYKKLNYSFDYGNWRFIVIGAQEMYLSKEKKQEQLKWMQDELLKAKDKQVMFFMHYHIMPIGLTQMESYTYSPVAFKKQMLNTITKYGNVKYVFSGHVHSGIKASIKSSVEYKGTKFINCPTPVAGRPFGEEYDGFSDKGRYKNRGFYLDVLVDGDNVELIGRKIKHSYKTKYPKSFKIFNTNMDKRAFTPESQLPFNKELINGDFSKASEGWEMSYRYQRDPKPMFNNTIKDGNNELSIISGYGSWTTDEYMETWQTVAMDFSRPNILTYNFSTPKVDSKGSGGYIRVFSYDKSGNLLHMILLHWGILESQAKYLYRAWSANIVGKRFNAFWLNKKAEQNRLLSFKIPYSNEQKNNNKLQIDLNKIFNHLLKNSKNKKNTTKISHIGIAHGVWARVFENETPIESQLLIHNVDLSHKISSKSSPLIILNNKEISIESKEAIIPYGSDFIKKIRSRNRK